MRLRLKIFPLPISLFKDKVGHPAFKIAKNPELVKDERPDLFKKLKKAYEKLNKMSVKGWDWH